MDRVTEITSDIFTALAQVRRADAHTSPVPDVLHRRMRSFVENAMRGAIDMGLTHQDSQDIGYVLVAIIDEIVVAKGGELREYWLPRLLQLQLFNENIAGEGVFQRLQVLMNDSRRVEVLKVYYLALLFGFQGKYRVRGGEIELADVTDRVADTLRRSGHLGEVELSPHGRRPKEGENAMRRNMPLVAISVGVLVVALIVYIALQLTLAGKASGVVDQIEQASQTATVGG